MLRRRSAEARPSSGMEGGYGGTTGACRPPAVPCRGCLRESFRRGTWAWPPSLRMGRTDSVGIALEKDRRTAPIPQSSRFALFRQLNAPGGPIKWVSATRLRVSPRRPPVPGEPGSGRLGRIRQQYPGPSRKTFAIVLHRPSPGARSAPVLKSKKPRPGADRGVCGIDDRPV